MEPHKTSENLFMQTVITAKQHSLGYFTWSYVSDAHAQMIMADYYIPPPIFEHPSRCYYRVLEVTKYEFRVVMCGIKSTGNIIQFRTAIQ
jgi:hypothetical protein